jgi:Putative DNA-binding domain
MTEQDFAKLIEHGHETHGVEFKGPGRRTGAAFLAEVIRAILGMANRQTGGLVIIGVDSESGMPDPVGLDEGEAKTWMNYDHLATSVNEFASPSVSFDLETVIFQDCSFIVIKVHEFGDIPILCRKDTHTAKIGR